MKLLNYYLIIIVSVFISCEFQSLGVTEVNPMSNIKSSGIIWTIKEGQNIQSVINNAKDFDKIILEKGDYRPSLGIYDALLYIDKPLTLEFKEGAIIHTPSINRKILPPKLITNQSPIPVFVDDFDISYSTLPSQPISILIKIDKNGKLNWAITSKTTPSIWNGQNIQPFTGKKISLDFGLQITPLKLLPPEAIYFITFEREPFFIIRVGNGFQKKYIDGICIKGKGILDGPLIESIKQTAHAYTLSSGILLNGRVKNVVVKDVSIQNCPRAIQIYSEHSGKYLDAGETQDGESFDALNILIDSVKVSNCIAGHLIGHPEHRGFTKNIVIRGNEIETASTGIEPNFRLSNFEVYNNIGYISSGSYFIHVWRGSYFGNIYNNILRKGKSFQKCVEVSSLPNWPQSSQIKLFNNTTF